MFRPTAALRALMEVVFLHNHYGNSPQMRTLAESVVRSHYDKHNLQDRDVEKARVKSAFHPTTEDPKEHLTVEFQKGNGDHVTTQHVYKD